MKRVALITGASSGIGAEFAKLAAADGYDVILVARRESELQTLAAELRGKHNVETAVLVEDLSAHGAVDRISNALKREDIEVSLLINNAGFGARGFFAETDAAREQEMIDVNMAALTMLTKKILPGMIQRKEGRILNVASTAAFVPGPLMAVYYATKAYVLSFSLALSDETQGTGVTVTCLCPGPTRTNFAKAAQMKASRLFRGIVMPAERVAREGYRACLRGKPLVIPGKRNVLIAFAARFSPRLFAARMARRAQENEV